MGLFNQIKKKTAMKDDHSESGASPVLIDLLSRYIGPARQRQIAFGEQVVRGQNWNVDLGNGLILFGENEYPVQLLGTESHSSGTWLWGFANPSGFPDAVLKASEYTYHFCKPAPELAQAETPLTKFANGHNIASIAAAAHHDKVCYYCCPYENGAAFVLVGGVPENVYAPVDAMRVITLLSELIVQLPFNHRLLVKSMMDCNCDGIDETGDTYTGRYADGTKLAVSFDEMGRIASMNTVTPGK